MERRNNLSFVLCLSLLGDPTHFTASAISAQDETVCDSFNIFLGYKTTKPVLMTVLLVLRFIFGEQI